MERTLSPSDVRKVLAVLRQLYALSDMETYPRRVVTALSTLIPADFVTYNEVHRAPSRTDRNKYVWWPSRTRPRRDSRLYKAFDRHVAEHPLIAHYARTRDERPLMISDFLSRPAFHRLKLYQEFFRPLGVEHQLAVTLTGSRGVVIGIALNRGARPFTERERRLLSHLRPHLIQAYQHALFASRSKRKTVRFSQVAPRDALSTRQLETLAWVAKGKTNGQIALLLEVSPRTVQKHLEVAFQKLGVETRTAAVMRAIELSLPVLA